MCSRRPSSTRRRGWEWRTEIEDLTGIEYFTALTWLDCSGNWLEKLDTSGNPALTELYCNGNYYLEELITSGNSALAYLDGSDSHCPSRPERKPSAGISGLQRQPSAPSTLSGNKALIDLDCSDNRLTSIDSEQKHEP